MNDNPNLSNSIPFKPCPFCGGMADIPQCTHMVLGLERHMVFCLNCGIAFFHTDNQDYGHYQDLPVLIEAWNKRYEPR